MGMLDEIKNKFSQTFTSSDDSNFPDEFKDDYVQIDSDMVKRSPKAKITIRPFVIQEFGDIKPMLDSLREGYTIALINIRPLKDRDMVELKRAINKLKKTCDAIEGDIAGFGDDWLVATPGFASVHRNKEVSSLPEEE